MVQRKVILSFCILRGTGHRVTPQSRHCYLLSLAKSKDKNKSLMLAKQISSSYLLTACSPCKNNLDLADFRMRTFHRFSLVNLKCQTILAKRFSDGC